MRCPMMKIDCLKENCMWYVVRDEEFTPRCAVYMIAENLDTIDDSLNDTMRAISDIRL